MTPAAPPPPHPSHPARKIRVLCVDDHPLVRKGIASILANEPDITLIAEGSSGVDAVALYRQHRPDVVLMDLRMPGGDGTTAVIDIRREFPDARIIALTSYDGDQDIYKALEAGVKGYLLKDMVHTDVLKAIRAVNAGNRFVPAEVAERLTESFPYHGLTSREQEVLALVARGLSNKQIAAQLGTATGTTKIHIQNILQKLKATDRTEAVTLAIRRGIIRLDS
ncbi:MAG: response regulator transcription factor [Phycisphaerales bacterium]|nr:response regulator transcription factor [Phycisphaerales bacterium]